MSYEDGRSADGQTPHFYDDGLVNAELSMTADEPWLSLLRNDGIDEAWLGAANNLVSVGSVDLRDKSGPGLGELVLLARHQFFGDYLGWSDEQHPLHKAYEELGNGSTPLIPLDTVIGTQRVIHGAGLNVAKVLKTHPRTLVTSPEVMYERIANLRGLGMTIKKLNASPGLLSRSASDIRGKIDNLSEAGVADPAKTVSQHPTILTQAPGTITAKIENLKALGLDPTRIINKDAGILTCSLQKVSQRVSDLDRIIRLFGWQHSAAELVYKQPAVLYYSKEKLVTHARLLAEHGDDQTMPVADVHRFIITSLEAHLIALSGDEDYDGNSVRRLTRRMDGPTRHEKVAELIGLGPEFEEKIGPKGLRAYLRYVGARKPKAKPKPKPTAKPEAI